MSISLKTHAFAGNPLKPKTPKTLDPLSPSRPSRGPGSSSPPPPGDTWRALARRRQASGDWLRRRVEAGVDRLDRFRESCGTGLTGELLVYLGSEGGGGGPGVVYWAADVSEEGEFGGGGGGTGLGMSFVELRTLMVATDWDDETAMGQLGIAGHARALLEWHNVSKFCGRCGEKNVPKEAGRRKQCSNDSCGHRVYPRVDPVVIMLVIVRENDHALLSRQSRFAPQMWSCLAGFLEPGESLEEAVRRETWEETGIEVGEVVYHSSQPCWTEQCPVPVDGRLLCVCKIARNKCRQRRIGRCGVARYKKAQRTAAAKVEQMCKGVEKGQNLSADFNVKSGELAPMFFPGPFAIAHHPISSWAFRDESDGDQARLKQPSVSFSNL